MLEHPLRPLLRPKSIAIVGVSRDLGRQTTINGSAVLESLTRFKYPGRIDLIHPEAKEIGGRRVYPSIAALSQTPDLVVLSLAAARVPDAIAESGSRGIRGAVVMSAGFSELGAGEGSALEASMKQAAERHGVRICGPNGLGYINVADGVYAGYYPCLSTAAPKPGGLAIVTHSGAIGNSLLARAVDRGLGFSFVVSAGNETNVSLADYIEFLVDDQSTRVISLYMEGTSDGARLRQALERAAEAGKPVVIYKVGKSAAGARAALSHTAKIAGEPLLYRGLFRQLGVIEASRIDDLIEIPMLLLKAKPMGAAPRSIGVVTISGGLGAIMADHFAAEGFALPELTPATQAQLNALPIKFGSVTNPVDTTAAIQRTEGTLADILCLVAADPGIDALVFPNASRFPQRALNVAQIMQDAATRFDKPLISVWYAGSDNAPALKLLHDGATVPCFEDPSAAARALAALRDVRGCAGNSSAPRVAPPLGARDAAGELGSGTLSEPAAKRVLQAYGVRIAREALVTNAAEAVNAATSIGFPVVLKIASVDVPHKAKVGGVVLGLSSAAEVAAAFDRMVTAVEANVPGARIEGVLVSELVTVRTEVLVGAYRDPRLGPALVVGAGGVDVEEMRDVAMRLLPVSLEDCRVAIGELQDSRIRLLPPEAKQALVASVARVAAMAWDLRADLEELDVNPIVVTPQGDAVALDAMMVLEERT